MSSRNPTISHLLSVVAGATLAVGLSQGAEAQNRTVIDITQVACQFLESENGVDHDYMTMRKADCERINAETGEQRLAEAEVLKLPAGDYTFRVTNVDVPYELGFWIREEDYDWRNPIHQATKISVSGGGLTTGTAKDYNVSLEPGEYLYSCPLNTTPDYRLIVE